jgi:hypothetical protein
MKQNPCRYCALSWEHNGKHYPSYESPCAECENIKKHKEYLKSKRLFEEGAPITSLDELLKQEWVMWFHQTRHIEVIKHTQLITVLNWLDRGAFHMAIRKESEEKSETGIN